MDEVILKKSTGDVHGNSTPNPYDEAIQRKMFAT